MELRGNDLLFELVIITTQGYDMLKIHFLNVGKGNCTVIKFPSGHLTVVDIDNSRNEDENILQCPIQFLEENYPNKNIFRFILTHPDMDHMSGLDELFIKRNIVNFWDTDHDKNVDINKMHLGGYNKQDWIRYQNIREQAEKPKVLKIRQHHESLNYWLDDNLKVLGPSNALIKKAKETGEHNHCSYVLKIEHEGIKILLGGDATKESWQDILAHHGKNELKTDVFLAPHHGSPANIEKDVFAHINPQYVIVSDHKGHSYDYQYYNSLASTQVYSTKHFGNITLEIGATSKKITPERNG